MDLSNKELQEKFDELSAAIVQVLQKGPKQSYEHVYRLAYTVTLYRKVRIILRLRSLQLAMKLIDLRFLHFLQPQGPELYALVRSLTAAHLRTQFNDKIIPVLPDLYNLPSSPPSGSTSSAVGPEKSEAPAGGGSSVVDQEDSHEQDRLAASETFLNAVLDVWDEHKRCMGMLRDVLKYLVSSRECIPCAANP